MPQTTRKYKHHRRHKSSSHKKFAVERFVTSKVFKILGIIVLLTGVFYALRSLNITEGLEGLLVKLFQPSDDLPIGADSEGFNVSLIYYYLPGILVLILAGLYTNRFSVYRYIISLMVVLYFTLIQVSIFVQNYVGGGGISYGNIATALMFLLLTIVVLFFNAMRQKKCAIVISFTMYYYLSLELALIMYVYRPYHIFPFIILYSAAIAWLAKKIHRPVVNLVNIAGYLFILSLFVLRKFIVRSQPDYLATFFIYAALFYILFYGVVIYSSMDKGKPMSKWMQITMGFTNFLFYAGTTAFVIVKYYSFDYLWILALALLLFNILGLYLSGKYFPDVWKLPLHIISIVLAALVLPLLLNQSTILLFTAGLSLLLLLYSKYSKNQPSIIISMISMGIMSLDFFFHWIFKYLPALVLSNALPEHTLLVHGILSGLIVVITLTLSIPLLKDLDVTLSKNVFSKIRYSRLIKGLTLISLFLTMGWIFSSLVFILSGSSQWVAPIWFVSGSLFFILLIILHPQQFSSFKKPILFLSLIFTLFYSILVHLNFLESLNNLMLTGIISSIDVSLHYISLGLLITLSAISLIRIYGLYPLNKIMRRGLQVFGLLIIILVFFTEYDNLSILFRASEFMLKPSLGSGQEILAFNHRLPYSIILIASSIGILVWSLFKHYRFLRNFSIILFSLSIVKIFLYDFTLLGEATRIVLFFFVGLLLISFSFFYPKLKKTASAPRNHHRRSSISDRQTNLKPET